MTSRIACVALPALALQVLRRDRPAWRGQPAAVVERDDPHARITHVDTAARHAGVRVGMRAAVALSFCPCLRTAPVPDARRREAVDAIVGMLRAFSPRVAPASDEAGVFHLDASGLSRLHPSLARWARDITQHLETARWHAVVVVGFSAFGTRVAARRLETSGRSRVAVFDSPRDERRAVRGAPVELAGLEPRVRDALEALGVRTVGAFADLPAAGIRRRFGEAAERVHRMARGLADAPWNARPAPDPVVSRTPLDWPERDLGRLMALVEREARELVRRVEARGQHVGQVRLALRFDDGTRADERLRPAAPTRDAARLVELLRLRLEARRPASGVVEVELVLEPVVVTEHAPADLFGARPRRDPVAAARALARVRARLGDGAVVRAVLREGHLPEGRFAWRPVDRLDAPSPRPVRVAPRIRRILPRPHALAAATGRHPEAPLLARIDDGTIRATHGPFVISGGWWRRLVHREYYYVQTNEGRILWIFFDRRRGTWFLQGEVE